MLKDFMCYDRDDDDDGDDENGEITIVDEGIPYLTDESCKTTSI